jgi:nucleoside-diphosphate-sugar epimerase
MKILVTGCSGRFGPYMVRELAGAGHELVLFDKARPDAAFSRWQWVEGDICRYEDCEKAAAAGCEAVLHLAAQPWPTDHPRQQERRRQAGMPVNQTFQVNVMGVYNVLHTAMLAGVKLFVMTSTNCVMGQASRISAREFPCAGLPVDEDQPSDVEDSYSFTKLVNERMLEMYSRVYGMRTYALRCAGLFDEAMRRQLAEKAKPVEKWDWGMWGWVAREDAASAHRLVLENAGKLKQHDAFLCNADDTFALEESRQLVEKFRPDLLKLIRGQLPGHASFISNAKLKGAVGWSPKQGWRQYLKAQ